MAGVEAEPPAAEVVFGSGLPSARRYAELLVQTGLARGLIGPHEAPRIWTRHLVNCAVIGEFISDGARVIDVGSGAGLPGVALACARPDLRVVLVDSLRRRTDFLTECVEQLGLDGRVSVVNGRAESAEVRNRVGEADWVTARAVAPLDRLVRWCLPLLTSSGTLLAMKGDAADTEVATHRQTIRGLGGASVEVAECGVEFGIEPTRVVRVIKR